MLNYEEIRICTGSTLPGSLEIIIVFEGGGGGRTDLSYLANNHLVTNYQNSMIMTGLIILVSLIDNDFIELSI